MDPLRRQAPIADSLMCRASEHEGQADPGATNGIGLAAAEALAKLGANVAIVGRNETRAKIADARIRAAAKGATVDSFLADLSSMAAVHKLASEVLARYSRLDVLVNNAGAMYTTRQLSVDGIELSWAVNHLAPFLLTNLLLDRLKASAHARVITTASEAHQGAQIPFGDLNAEGSYQGFGRYGQTKLANILFTSELARRLEGTGVTASCFHPGLVASGFNRNNGLLMDLAMTGGALRAVARSPAKGAETLVWLAISPDAPKIKGGYYADMQLRRPSAEAQNPEAARQLWDVSAAQCPGLGQEKPA